MTVGVSDHAVARYQERVKPALSFAAAKRELLALIHLAPGPTTTPPAGFEHAEGSEFIELAPGIVLVVDGRVGVTVLTRAGFGEEIRERRNEKRKARRARTRGRARKRFNNHSGRPEEGATWGVSWPD